MGDKNDLVNDEYPKGFHVCLTRKWARTWSGTQKKVKFKDIRAVGFQVPGIDPCIVVGQILITKERG